MKTQAHTGLVMKIMIVGIFLALLAYVFHPGVGNMHIIINGKPLGGTAAYFTAIPTLLLIILFTAIFSALVFMEVGMILLLGFLLLGAAGLLVFMPYFWPVLALVLLTLLLASLGGSGKSD